MGPRDAGSSSWTTAASTRRSSTPNAVGIGGQNLAAATDDPVLRRLCVEIYNDSMAELQEWSNNRFLPMPVLPAWSIDECVREAERCAGLGFRGVNMTSDPQDAGSHDLAHRDWDALWEVCADLNLPVHFHIGASLTSLNFYGKYFWPSLHDNMKPAVGGAMLFLNNARVVINSVYAGIFDRHPTLKMVSVESGMGWIPFILETMDYEILENAPAQAAELLACPVGVLQGPLVRHVLVREERRRPPGPHRQGRRGQRDVRDRLPAPHVPVPQPPRDRRGGHALAPAGDPP